jgi:hypothetical protein
MLLMDLFDRFSVQCILSIYLPQSIAYDKWFWVPFP